MKYVKDLYKNDLGEYSPIPFWSWNNKLTIDNLLREIDDLGSTCSGGFIMHARTGLRTPYLGKEWFECVGACIDEAMEAGMNAWVYDENGWPSGFVGGKLLRKKEFLATYLEHSAGSYDKKAFASFLCDKGNFTRVFKDEGEGEYHNIYLRYSPSNVDILNPEVVTAFINETYEKYYEKFGDKFGTGLKGFFTDEPQYFRYATPYSVAVEGYFQEKYGEDVKDGLIHLFFDGDEHSPFRVRYYSALNDLYTENYYKRIYEWCKGHGCQFTGHSVEESKHTTQMWGGAGCMPSYEYESIPAIDNLGKNGSAELSARQVGSVAAQLGKKHVLTETFACSGSDATPRKLRSIAEKQYVHGVNMLCCHLYPYSLAGQAKTDHPPVFSPHCMWTPGVIELNLYLTRLGYLLAEGGTNVKVGVLSPMTSVYLNYYRDDERKAGVIDEKFGELQNMLLKANVEYHIIDEKILARHGEVDGAKLKVGLCEYDYLIIPYAPNVLSSTRAAIEKYLAAGGKIFMPFGAPAYEDGVKTQFGWQQNCDLGEISAAAPFKLGGDGVDYTYRTLGDVQFAFVYNPHSSPAKISFDRQFLSVDLITDKAVDVGGELTLAPEGSALLMRGVAENGVAYETASEEDITDKFKMLSSDPNVLTLDYIRISEDGKRFSKPLYVYEAFDKLVRESYRGKLYVRYEFYVKSRVGSLKLMREKGRMKNTLVNGKPVKFDWTWFDHLFEEADITDAVKLGKNVYEFEIDYYQRRIVRHALFDPEATESVRNCLTFDTEIEQAYILGDFSLKDRCVATRRRPPLTDIANNGYQHFAGDMAFSCNYRSDRACRALIELSGEYMLGRVRVNGKMYEMTLTGSGIIPLKRGWNKIELHISASLRNMIGPLHCKNPETGVSPFNFRMLGEYGKENSAYTTDYIIKPFGVTKVVLKKLK